jgi:hypothetical protein
MITTNLKDGQIVHSLSQIFSLILSVKMKDRGKLMCIYYRKLYKYLKIDIYILPRINTILGCLTSNTSLQLLTSDVFTIKLLRSLGLRTLRHSDESTVCTPTGYCPSARQYHLEFSSVSKI